MTESKIITMCSMKKISFIKIGVIALMLLLQVPFGVPTASATSASSIVAAIEAGKSELSLKLNELTAKGENTWRLTEEPSAAEVYLAVWNKSDLSMRIIKIRKSGSSVTMLDGSGTKPYVSVNNKMFSVYRFKDVNDLAVGVLYPQLSANGNGYVASYRYYVPLLSDFFVPEVMASGSDYLSRIIGEAYAEIDERGVMSVAYPDKKLTDVIDPYLVKAITVIEHSSHVKLLSDFQPEKEMGDFFARLGLNGGEAFGSAVSSAGARGLAQFIPSTYASMVKNRPNLGLISGFNEGMSNHVNAVKAIVGYMDMNLAELPRDIRVLHLQDRQASAEFLAAAYNGGSTRVRWAYEEWGDDWANVNQMSAADAEKKYQQYRNEVNRLEPLRLNTSDSALRAKYEKEFWAAVSARESYKAQIRPLSKASLRTETVNYVKKLKRVYVMLLSGYYATPNAPANEMIKSEAATPVVAEERAEQPAVSTPELTAGNNVICFDEGSCVSI